MSARALLERLLSPGLGWCYRCLRPWKVNARKKIGKRSYQQLGRLRWWGLIGVESHSTRYSESAACFPLCEGCWSKLTPKERLPYYDMLVEEWIRQMPSEEADYRRKQVAITVAVGNEDPHA